MAVRLITYDLNAEKKKTQDYTDIIAYIKKHNWARLSESSYAIESNEDPQTIFTALTEYLDENDHLLVMTLARPYFGRHAAAVVDWLAAKL